MLLDRMLRIYINLSLEEKGRKNESHDFLFVIRFDCKTELSLRRSLPLVKVLITVFIKIKL